MNIQEKAENIAKKVIKEVEKSITENEPEENTPTNEDDPLKDANNEEPESAEQKEEGDVANTPTSDEFNEVLKKMKNYFSTLYQGEWTYQDSQDSSTKTGGISLVSPTNFIFSNHQYSSELQFTQKLKLKINHL